VLCEEHHFSFENGQGKSLFRFVRYRPFGDDTHSVIPGYRSVRKGCIGRSECESLPLGPQKQMTNGSRGATSQSSVALSSRALKALEYCLGGRENRNHLRIPIEHSNGQGAIDDAKYRRCRRPFVDCEGL
jgi:hypothetical protein